jgi:hypothetical protein
MASGNYIVRDIVQYIHDENDYGTQRSVLNVCARLKHNFWIFIIIIFFSCSVGYVAVYVPGALEAQQAKMDQTFDRAGGMKSKLKGMSDEQKAQLLQQFGGAMGGK